MERFVDEGIGSVDDLATSIHLKSLDPIAEEIPAHNTAENLSPLNRPQKRLRRSYACETCGTIYTEKRTLDRHFRTPAHCAKTGQTLPSYCCQYCPKHFTRDDIRQRHEREMHFRIKRPEPRKSQTDDWSAVRFTYTDLQQEVMYNPWMSNLQSGQNESTSSDCINTEASFDLIDPFACNSEGSNACTLDRQFSFDQRADYISVTRHSSFGGSYSSGGISVSDSAIDTSWTPSGSRSDSRYSEDGSMFDNRILSTGDFCTSPVSLTGSFAMWQQGPTNLSHQLPSLIQSEGYGANDSEANMVFVRSASEIPSFTETEAGRANLLPVEEEGEGEEEENEVIEASFEAFSIHSKSSCNSTPTAPGHGYRVLSPNEVFSRNARRRKSPICHFCRDPFGETTSEVQAHLQRHYEKLTGEYTCDDCQIGFTHKKDLQKHQTSAKKDHGRNCGFDFEHNEPCQGHHPPRSDDESVGFSDNDRMKLCYMLRHWEQAQLRTYMEQVYSLLSGSAITGESDRWSTGAILKTPMRSLTSLLSNLKLGSAPDPDYYQTSLRGTTFPTTARLMSAAATYQSLSASATNLRALDKTKSASDVKVLASAAKSGKKSMVEHLISKGVRVNAAVSAPKNTTDETGASGMVAWSALAYAVVNGHSDVVKLLLEKGASVSQLACNLYQCGYVLGVASTHGYIQILEELFSGSFLDGTPRSNDNHVFGGACNSYIVDILLNVCPISQLRLDNRDELRCAQAVSAGTYDAWELLLGISRAWRVGEDCIVLHVSKAAYEVRTDEDVRPIVELLSRRSKLPTFHNNSTTKTLAALEKIVSFDPALYDPNDYGMQEWYHSGNWTSFSAGFPEDFGLRRTNASRRAKDGRLLNETNRSELPSPPVSWSPSFAWSPSVAWTSSGGWPASVAELDVVSRRSEALEESVDTY